MLYLIFRLKPLSIAIGHFFSPIKIEITCHKGSICHIDNLRMKNCEGEQIIISFYRIYKYYSDDSPVIEVCPSSTSLLCSSSSHSKCLSHDRICDLSSDCSNGEDEQHCGHISYHSFFFIIRSFTDDIPSFGLCDFSDSTIGSFCTNWTSSGDLEGISFGEASGRKGDQKYIGQCEIKYLGNSMKFLMNSKDPKDLSGRRIMFTSPSLPATSTKLTDPRSPLFRSCTVSYYF